MKNLKFLNVRELTEEELVKTEGGGLIHVVGNGLRKVEKVIIKLLF